MTLIHSPPFPVKSPRPYPSLTLFSTSCSDIAIPVSRRVLINRRWVVFFFLYSPQLSLSLAPPVDQRSFFLSSSNSLVPWRTTTSLPLPMHTPSVDYLFDEPHFSYLSVWILFPPPSGSRIRIFCHSRPLDFTPPPSLDLFDLSTYYFSPVGTPDHYAANAQYSSIFPHRPLFLSDLRLTHGFGGCRLPPHAFCLIFPSATRMALGPRLDDR